MSDTSNPYAAGFFFAGPGTNMKMREKIALAAMMQKRNVPKNLGEGIFSIGQDIGDALAARSLEQADREAQLVASKLGAPADPSAITPVSAVPEEDVSQDAGPKQLPIAAAQPALATPSIVPSGNLPPAAPAKPLPPDQQQSYEPGAPVRLSSPEQTQDWRNQNPLSRGLPPVPGAAPGPPPSAPLPVDQPARPSVADYGQKLALAPTPPPPPVMAQGPDDDPRRAVALTMLKQQMGGQGGSPPPAPAPAPSAALAQPPAPDQGIRPAPPNAQMAQVQPGATAGYVPPKLADPTGAKIIQPSRREMELTAVMAANQGNPYAATSRAAKELENLVKTRDLRQTEENEKFKAGIARTTKSYELSEQAKVDQLKRIQDSERARIEIGDLPAKLREEGLKRQQELITQPGQAGQVDLRLLGTDRSPQRTGIPVAEPVPPGIAADVWQKSQEKKITADAAGLEAVKPELAEALDLMNQARNHPWKSASLGTGGKLAQMTAGGQGFAAIMEQLGGKNLVAAYQKIKGTGPVSEQEGANIAKAQARLTTAQSEDDYNKAMDDLEGSLRGAVERAERRMNRPVTAYQKSPDDPVAPDIGQPSPGGTKIYIGGDPAKPSSWKKDERRKAMGSLRANDSRSSG